MVERHIQGGVIGEFLDGDHLRVVERVIKEREKRSAVGDSDCRRVGATEDSDSEVLSFSHGTGEGRAVAGDEKVARLDSDAGESRLDVPHGRAGGGGGWRRREREVEGRKKGLK